MKLKLIPILMICIIILNCDNNKSETNIKFKPISVLEKNGNIYIHNPNTNKERKITKDKTNLSPIISPNKMFIAYIKEPIDRAPANEYGERKPENAIWLYNVETNEHRIITPGGFFDGKELLYEDFGNVFFSENSEITFYHDSEHILFTGAGGSGGSVLFKLNIESKKVNPLYYGVLNFQVIDFSEILIEEKKYYRNKGGFYFENVMIDINGNFIN